VNAEQAISVDHEVVPDPTDVEVLVWVSQSSSAEYGTGTPLCNVVFGNQDPALSDPRRWKGGENTKAVLVKIRVPLSELRYLR
jgi:hypothetical protein